MHKDTNFDKIIDQITDAFFIIDAEGIITYASASVNKLVGHSPDGLVGHSSLEFIHPEEHHFAYDNQKKLLSYPGSRVTHDYRILTAHNSYRWMEFVFVNMINIPQVGGIMVQMRDVSERKTTELMLEESQEQFHLFMNHIPAPAWIRDDQSRYVFVNDSFQALMSKSEAELLGKTYQELFPEFIEQINDTDHLCRDYGKEIEFIMQGLNRNGVMKDFVIYKFPIVRSSGKVFIGAIGFDLSRINEAKGIVKSAEDKFKLIFNHAPDAIFIEDEHGQILDANRKACELQGIALPELIGKNILDLTPDHQRASIASQYKDLWAGKINSLSSFTWKVNGEEIPVEIHAGKITHLGSEALILTLRDLSTKVVQVDMPAKKNS